MLNWKEITKRIFSLYDSSNQTELGEKIGVSQDTISRWVTGKAKPTWDHLSRISKQTGKSEEWLLTGKEDAPTQTVTASDGKDTDRLRTIRAALQEQVDAIDQIIEGRGPKHRE